MRRLILALLVVGVLAGVFVVLQRRQVEELRQARVDAKLLEFDQRAIDGLDVGIRGETYRFELEDDGWWLVEPIRDRAEETRLSYLMTLSRRSEVLLRIEEPEAPEAYGLDAPTLELEFHGAEVAGLSIGSVSPDGQGVYARIEGNDEVLLVEAPAGGPFTNPDVEVLRESSVTGVPRSAVERIGIRGDGTSMVLERDERGWWIASDGRRPAFDGAIGRILDRLDGAEIVRFVDGADPADPTFGLGDGARVLELGGAGVERVVRIGAETPGGEVYLRREDRPPVLVVAGLGETDRLVPPADELLDRKLTKVNRYRVREVEYRRDDATVRLVRDDSGWTADGEPVTDDAAFAFLARLFDAPVRGWEERDPPAGSPSAEVAWVLEDGSEGTIRLWGDRTAVVDGVRGIVATLRMDAPDVPTF